MKRFFKNLSLATILLLGVSLAACSETKGPNSSTDNTPTEDNPTIPGESTSKPTDTVKPTDTTKPTDTVKPTETTKPDDDKLEYVINITAESGKPLKDFYVEAYLNDKFVSDGFTDNTGKVSFNLKPNEYEIRVQPKDGYILNTEVDHTDLLGTPLNFVCTTELIEKAPANNFRYELGDVMYDFTLTDPDGKTFNLKQLMETKEVVILNFWASWCGNCIGEFPFLNEAYESNDINGNPYSDSVALLAVNAPTPGQGEDSNELIKKFKTEKKYSFDLMKDYKMSDGMPGLTTLFGITAIPVTVIIDKYFNIAEIELGAVPDTNKWKLTFDEYIDPNYQPHYEGNGGAGGDSNEPQIPDVEMPSSEAISKAINGVNWDTKPFTTTYYPEKDSADAKYAWPFIISDDGNYIQSSNRGIDNSFAMMHFNVNLKKDEVFTFDYFSSTEKFNDVLYILVDGMIVTNISGISSKIETCYAFPANYDNEYKITLIYQKDGSGSQGDDTVKLNNFRILKTESIDKQTFVYREAASGVLDDFTGRYEHYITPVFNAQDGYYHVNDINGPILLADLISGSNYNPSQSLYEMVAKNPDSFIIDGVNYGDLIAEYAVYCSASTLGYVPVTEELKVALQKSAIAHSENKDYDDQWIELTCYYNAYFNDGKELESPIKGLTTFDHLDLDVQSGEATVNIDRIIQSLNGYMFEFKPVKSGVYKFYSVGDIDTEFDVFDADGRYIYGRDELLRDFMIDYDNGKLSTNFVSYQYYDSAKTYYIRPRFSDMFGMGEITFKWEFIGNEYDKLKAASGPMFTTPEDYEGNVEDNVISVGVPAILADDGFYHVDGSNAKDTLIYFDAKHTGELFGLKYDDLINPIKGVSAFDFRYDDLGGLRINEQGQYLKKALETLEDGSKVEIIENGKYVYTKDVVLDKVTGQPIVFTDMTEAVKAYVNANIIDKPGDILDGCVPVNAEFAKMLQLVMDKFTFEGVDNSWLKLCYYFDHVGPNA